MAYDIGPKIGIEGEAQFKKAISEINSSLKTMGTEMKAVTSAFDKNDKSVENLTAQNGVLNKQIDAQKTKLGELSAAQGATTFFSQTVAVTFLLAASSYERCESSARFRPIVCFAVAKPTGIVSSVGFLSRSLLSTVLCR